MHNKENGLLAIDRGISGLLVNLEKCGGMSIAHPITNSHSPTFTVCLYWTFLLLSFSILMPKDNSELANETLKLSVASQTLKKPDRIIETYLFHLCVLSLSHSYNILHSYTINIAL